MSNQIINSTSQNFLIDVFKALNFAAIKHRHQKRKGVSGIPYINHPIGVTSLLIQKINEPSKEIIISSILHDVIEDTNTSPEELKLQFGGNIMNLVMEVSDDMTLSYSQRKNIQIIKANTLSYEARCIKIADKTCNIRDILATRIYWSRKQKIRYIEWAIQVISRIRDTHKGLVEEFDITIGNAEEILKYKF